MTPDIPTNPEQRWEWIKYQLRSAGCSLRKLAVELDVSDSAVQLTKYMPYPRMERAIAKKLSLKPMQLWPERWNADGTPCRQRPNRAEKCASPSTYGNNATHLCTDDSRSNAIAHRQLAREA